MIARHQNRNAGVSLIELMIALVIGALLLLGLVEIFSASRTAYQLSTGLARVQENGRFAMDFLQRDLRMTGHLGCVNDQARFLPESVTATRPALVSTLLATPGDYSSAPDPSLRFDVGIEGYDAGVDGGASRTGSGSTVTLTTNPVLAASAAAWAPALPSTLFAALNSGTTGKPIQNSDIVVLRFFSPTGAPMASFTPGNPATLTFTNGPRLTDGVTAPGLFGISDCINAALFEATTATIPATNAAVGQMTVSINGANKSGLLGNQTFVAGQAVIYRAESLVYYVGINLSGNPTLYRLRYQFAQGAGAVTYQKEELVEGIESLQLQYGQDSKTQYVDRPTGNMGSSALASNIVVPTDLPAPNTAADQSAAGWRRVGVVQVGLVARSPDTAAATKRDAVAAGSELSALGVKVVPPAVNDGRYRTVYEDSIAFRNRLFGN